MRGDYSTTAFWYQTEPHRPLEVLPRPDQRRPRAPVLNILQWGLLLVAGLTVIALLCVLILSLRPA